MSDQTGLQDTTETSEVQINPDVSKIKRPGGSGPPDTVGVGGKLYDVGSHLNEQFVQDMMAMGADEFVAKYNLRCVANEYPELQKRNG